MSAADLAGRRGPGPSDGSITDPVDRSRRHISTRFLRSELGLIFGRRRNQAGMGVLASVPVLIAIAVKVSTPHPGRGPDFFASITSNGLFVALAALTIELALFLPLAVGAIAGDSVAGEANIGTLRYLLAVPVGRTRLLAVKFAAIVIFSMVATVWVSLVGAVAGLVLFGGGEMTLLSGTQIGMGQAHCSSADGHHLPRALLCLPRSDRLVHLHPDRAADRGYHLGRRDQRHELHP